MPEADGLELSEAFRREFFDTKIIAISGGGKRTKEDYLAFAPAGRRCDAAKAIRNRGPSCWAGWAAEGPSRPKGYCSWRVSLLTMAVSYAGVSVTGTTRSVVGCSHW
jgi:hypothetical protein